MGLLPEGATAAAGVLLRARGLRAFVDGLVAVVLPSYLVAVGLSTGQVGAVVTATLLGSAALTLAVGVGAHRIPRRRLLQLAAITMVLTGLGFALVTSFWLLLPVAIIGTLNPSSGDVSIFLPTEQALLPATVADSQRTTMYARYSVVAFVLAAFGSLAAGVPDAVGERFDIDPRWALGSVFVAYAACGVVLLSWYRRIPDDLAAGETGAATPLRESRAIVYRLAATFSLDALGGGFVVQAMLVLWLHVRYDLSIAVTGGIFFWTGLLSGASALAAPRLARRIGLIRTMAYTRLPANGLLIATAFMPNAPLAVACLLARSLLSQMDVPARQSYVMAVVTPGERAAAASVTNVPRSLASALPPLAAGWMLEHSSFGWPLLIGGSLKAGYDLLLLWQFHDIRPPEEVHISA
ncbi:MAG: MFS transporter [Acidimicrobiales bacterium]